MHALQELVSWLCCPGQAARQAERRAAELDQREAALGRQESVIETLSARVAVLEETSASDAEAMAYYADMNARAGAIHDVLLQALLTGLRVSTSRAVIAPVLAQLTIDQWTEAAQTHGVHVSLWRAVLQSVFGVADPDAGLLCPFHPSSPVAEG